MDSWIESTLSKFINGNKLCGAAGTLEGTDAIQRDIDRLERWACVNLMSNKAEWQFQEQGNSKNKYRLSEE